MVAGGVPGSVGSIWRNPVVTRKPHVQFPQRRAITVPPQQPGRLCIWDLTIIRMLVRKRDHQTIIKMYTEGSLGDHVQVMSQRWWSRKCVAGMLATASSGINGASTGMPASSIAPR